MFADLCQYITMTRATDSNSPITLCSSAEVDSLPSRRTTPNGHKGYDGQGLPDCVHLAARVVAGLCRHRCIQGQADQAPAGWETFGEKELLSESLRSPPIMGIQ